LPDTLLSRRKSEHLQIVASQDVTHKGGTLLGNVQLLHQALPELSVDDIDLSVEFFGKRLNAPLMITSMTGGAEYAGQLNHNLAKVSQQQGVAFAVGSQRVMIRHPEVTNDFAVRSNIPDGVLLGNIGAVQLQEYSPDIIMGLVKAIDADGICVHLNAGQELMPLKQLNSIGVTYIDVSGAGGTSWTKVEAYRAADPNLKHLGELFSDWGVPTAFSVIAARNIMTDKAMIIGSGGIMSGMDAARCIACGADIAGFARPALLAFLDRGAEGVSELLERYAKELKTAMLLTGSKNIAAMQNAPKIYNGELKTWLDAYGLSGGK